MKYFINIAKTEDIKQIRRIEEDCFHKSDRFKYAQIWNLVNNGKGSFLVYRDEDLIHGYIYFRHLSESLAWVYSLAVDPPMQRRGIAEKLMLKAEEWASITHKFIQLEVKDSNYPARYFYKKMGYKEDSIKINYYKDGSDAILMKKELPHAQG